MSETLVTCPHCHTPNFTERGLAAHRCKALEATTLDPEALLSGAPAAATSPMGTALAVMTTEAVETGWQDAKRLADLAKNFSRASTAAKALCGIRLRALREHYFGPRNAQGGRPKKTPNDSGFSNWGELLADKVGITDDTASNWMKMADAVEHLADHNDVNLQDVLTTMPWDWTPAETFLLERTVQRITEGRSQKELLALQNDYLADLGCERKEKGGANNPAGRNGSANPPKPAANPQELLKQRQEAARLKFTGTTEPGKAAPGSPALFLDRFVETAGTDLEALSQAELRHLYEHTVKPFAAAFRQLAGL